MSIFCLDREFADSEGTPYAGVPRTADVFHLMRPIAKSSDFASILEPLLEYIIVFIALSDNLEQPNLPLQPASRSSAETP